MKKADIGVAMYVLAAFVMMIVPIPAALLDVLLAVNIAVAFTILFSCMFAKEVLAQAQGFLQSSKIEKLKM